MRKTQKIQDTLLLSGQRDGKWTLKRNGSAAVEHFESKVEALAAIYLMPNTGGAWMVVCNARGEIESQGPL